MPRNRIAIVLALSFVVAVCAANAQESPTDQLALAWREYGLQAFSTANDLFADVAETAQGETRWQALLGQAQIVHFQMPGRDPEEAIPLYKALLAEVGDKAEWRGQVLARLADCHTELVPVQIDKARELYREALATLPATSLMVQETALRFLATYLQRPDRAEIARGLKVSDEFAEQMAGTPFASVFHGLRAEMAFFTDNYRALAEALDQQYRAGINNVSVKENVLFRLARLFEVELDDYVKAEAYYRQLASEVPSSRKAHFAILRADELKAGKLDSDYAPALSPQVEDAMGKEQP